MSYFIQASPNVWLAWGNQKQLRFPPYFNNWEWSNVNYCVHSTPNAWLAWEPQRPVSCFKVYKCSNVCSRSCLCFYSWEYILAQFSSSIFHCFLDLPSPESIPKILEQEFPPQDLFLEKNWSISYLFFQNERSHSTLLHLIKRTPAKQARTFWVKTLWIFLLILLHRKLEISRRTLVHNDSELWQWPSLSERANISEVTLCMC